MNGKQLKNSILQWAIQGKLVPQDPNDEPATVLLQRIRDEKARLIKEGKLKKDKNETIIYRGDDNSHYEKLPNGEVRCIDDEIPFEIPGNWAWCRIVNIASSQLGKTLDRGKEQGNEYPYLCSINVYWEGVDLTKVKTFRLKDDELERYKLTIGDLLICEGGDYGRCSIWDSPIEMYYQNALHRVRFYNNISPYFYKYVVEIYRNIGYIKGQGQTIKHFTFDNMKSLLFPVPPLNEQNRIVAKIVSLQPIIDKYSQAQQELDNINSEIYDLLKKSILQEAIQGRLVPQDSNDEPAEVLLQRIKKEKERLVAEGKLKRKDIVESTIYRGDDNKYYEKCGNAVACIDDEIPFEVPNTWSWCKIGDLFMHNNGKQLNKGNSHGRLMEYITTSNLYWDGFVLDNLKQMPFEESEIERCKAVKGDLLVCEGGDVGRACIWLYDQPIMLQNHLHKLRAYLPICTEYVYYVFYLYNQMGIIGGKGIGIQGFSSKALHNTKIPLPPLAEQWRIVDKIKQALASIMSR